MQVSRSRSIFTAFRIRPSGKSRLRRSQAHKMHKQCYPKQENIIVFENLVVKMVSICLNKLKRQKIQRYICKY